MHTSVCLCFKCEDAGVEHMFGSAASHWSQKHAALCSVDCSWPAKPRPEKVTEQSNLPETLKTPTVRYEVFKWFYMLMAISHSLFLFHFPKPFWLRSMFVILWLHFRNQCSWKVDGHFCTLLTIRCVWLHYDSQSLQFTDIYLKENQPDLMRKHKYFTSWWFWINSCIRFLGEKHTFLQKKHKHAL